MMARSKRSCRFASSTRGINRSWQNWCADSFTIRSSSVRSSSRRSGSSHLKGGLARRTAGLSWARTAVSGAPPVGMTIGEIPAALAGAAFILGPRCFEPDGGALLLRTVRAVVGTVVDAPEPCLDLRYQAVIGQIHLAHDFD